MNLSEQYNLTLEQEVTREYAAYVMNKLINLLIEENISDDNDPLMILQRHLSHLKNNQILNAEDLNQLNKIDGKLQYFNDYIDDLIEKTVSH
ncbi:hypothetical protein BAU15_02750 [Enterococcus sp. JM4C]|uniref:hypothetical protein n=1 Tax=Candidatus Enterococcus huntleyi TaxID=1857217 RepID=UPI00137A9F22|nr:hypothetical protein [Enterococcus sp. JM4C]KAF1299580.1 hypothetical protein BAU15_02750 [Enterococcus sp. JM4C]